MIFLDLTKKAAFKCILILLSTLGALLISQTTIARGGLFFNISATGTPANLSITLCLNGKGPLSCQNYAVSALNLNISTTIPNHVYPSVGIKINTPGYSLMGCTPSNNGYCLFSASNTAPARIIISKGQTTLTPSVTSLALSVNCPPLTAGCTYTNNALTGHARQITITNNGAMAASNVSVISSGFPAGTTITSSTCDNILGPNESCTITITPGITATSECTTGTAPTNGPLTVMADGAIATQVSVVVLSYSCIYQGGYVYSIDDTTLNTVSIGGKVAAQFDQATPPSGIIWSSDSAGNYDGGVSIWGIDDTSTSSSPSPNASSVPPATRYSGQSNCNGAIDGSCNTNNIYVYYSTIAASTPPLSTYATGLCKQIISGYSDWYLPAICEMGPDDGSLICTSPPLLQLQQNMADNLPVLLNNCIGSMCLAGDYWSSTEQSGNPLDNAWSECFASNGGSSQCIDIKSDSTLGVRCSRALTS
ncbi:DUF1566 domain-containing protein [Legionella maioricensis]|uniref:DUF1566 domain-containing protein n=1 Tax=Legionella maioricensis TaxID=2896528 RepID=A0A9X2IBF3_9GAMM|nr:DUF1566 domain-containing protein [Legionella maioricensis]MCL9684395.1 DUF1566 domain-containing protein [Legionella maioricensis]MCL9687576.1 DUF1566 domain-containing protein [Legionella maioricensis]